MKIAVIGIKGLAGSAGGIERHAEELYPRLAKSGHEITAYCRREYTGVTSEYYKGVRIKLLPSLNTKHFDAISHTLLATIHSLSGKYDIVHIHAIGPSLLSFIPGMRLKTKVLVTIHALDWQSEKWGAIAKSVLKMGERTAFRFADNIIVVSKGLADYSAANYPNAAITYIPNGVPNLEIRSAQEIREKFALSAHDYLLYAGRLVPEKGCHNLIKVFKDIETTKKLVIAGGESHSSKYVSLLRDLAAGDDRIIFAGHQTGSILEELYSNAIAFISPSNKEGLPIALMEALSYELPVLCSDIPPHEEVVQQVTGGNSSCLLYNSSDLGEFKTKMELLINNTAKYKEAASGIKRKVMEEYDWDLVAKRTEEMYVAALNSGAGKK